MSVWTVKTSDGATMKITYEPSKPETGIYWWLCDVEDEETWHATGHQCADAKDAKDAAMMVLDYLDDDASIVTVTEDA